MRITLRLILPLVLLAFAMFVVNGALAQTKAPIADDQISPAALASSHIMEARINGPGMVKGKGNIPTPQGIDTIVNFTGHFEDHAIYFDGTAHHIWEYSMVGNPPEHGGRTVFNAPIVPVTLDLRNADGTPRFVNGKPLISSPDAFVPLVQNSPVFSNASFSSSNVPTQFTDAIQKAEFGSQARTDWHTLLSPGVKTGRTMKLIRGTYRFALNPDGSCCLFVLVDDQTFQDKLFPPANTFPDNSTVIGAAEVAGDITTKDISTFLFPNTFLYFNNDPNQCCVLGFHSLDLEAGDASNGNEPRLYVVNYSSWISPGIFADPSVQDVTALSHELSETFNDPFLGVDGIHNVTPFWLSPNGNCQDTMEVGDVIEDLPNETFPIKVNDYMYHPQNEALLPWFEFKGNSFAIDNAYSYPDESVLTALSAPQLFNCGH